MGNHYVPQYYLKGFAADGDTVWAYDKSSGRIYSTNMRNVATQNGFYSPEIENRLTQEVENPANPIIGRIRMRIPISTEEKQVLAAYMICMRTRVPEGKRRARLIAPSVEDGVKTELDSRLNTLLEQEPEKAALIEQRRVEAHELIKKWAKDPPDDLWFRTILPAKFRRALPMLASMTWRFLTFDRYPAFITSDNPVFFFDQGGLIRPDAEVSFPISSHISLWATHRKDLPQGFFATTEQAVKEINRRTASRATRFAFHSIQEHWVMRLLTRRSWRLHMLR